VGRVCTLTDRQVPSSEPFVSLRKADALSENPLARLELDGRPDAVEILDVTQITVRGKN
jgi:hypothetical protein